MYLEIFLADFAFFGEFRGISRKYLNFAGPRPREISEALQNREHQKYLWNIILLRESGNKVQARDNLHTNSNGN